MIIADQSAKRRPWILGIILSALAAALLLVLWFALKPTESPYKELPKGAVFCGAETARGGQLMEKGIPFGNSGLRSQETARSGSYSCKLPASGQTEYGFQYLMEQPRPGTAYKASVWRQHNAVNSGLLAVQLEGEAAQYLQDNTAVESDGQGWEKLEVRFFIPYGKATSSCKVYVYSGGDVDVFFDDLLIEQLSPEEEGFKPEVLHLRIKKQAMDQLQEKRAEALRAGILETNDGDWVEAKLEGDSDKVMNVEVRLKGDWLDHLRGDKWSFRVKMKGGHSWRRMQSFSLHTPLARYYLHEWLLHQLWEKEDVLTTRYDFVELWLNGQALGIYAYEEHFDKQLVEYRQRREGPVLKFSEDGYWSAIKRQLAHHGFMSPNAEHAALDWQNADIEAFESGKYEEGSLLARQYEQARILMQQYREGLTLPEDIFDIRQLARYYAICDVLNGYHGIAWHNQRFYYNPVTSQLEPIGFDGYGSRPETQYTFLGQGALNPESLASKSIFAALFMDRRFAETYIEELYRLSSRQYLEPFLDSIYPEWSARLSFLQLEFPDYKPLLQDFLAQAQYIHSMILPMEEYSLQAYSQQVRGQERLLRLENRHNLPLEIVGYGINKKNMAYPLDSALVLPAQIPRMYWLRLRRDSVIRDFGQLRFQEEAALKNQAAPRYYELRVSAAAFHLFYRVLGTDSLFSAPILEWKSPEGNTDAQALLHRAKLRADGPYRVAGKRILFPPGDHVVQEDIVLPPGYFVYFEEGAGLDLRGGAHFISFSPVHAFGTEERPVRIFSSDGSGSGFTVMGSPEKSILKHTIFEGLNTLKAGGWELTGAVTFYQSDVELYRCVFRDNQCEDGLNIIRSEFEVRQCLFSDAPFDGFDADFCKGKVENSRFIRTGNDGLDFSGCIVNVRDCYFEGNGDKGISVGEESDVTVFDCEIRRANIALASKDLSLLYVKNIILVDCEQGFAAYQKKPEFGVSRIIVESYQAEDVRRLHTVSDGSSLQLVDKVIQ